MSTEPRGVQVRGIPVRAHWSVLVVLGLFTWSLAAQLLPDAAKGYPTAAYWAAAVGCGVLFMLCLLAHELAHALVARRVGLRVRRITLWLLGGMAQVEGRVRSPRADLAVAVSGPAVSAVCSGVFLGAGELARAQGAGRLPVEALFWLAWANGAVAVFNMLPAAPLDGGRVLRALLWWRGASRERASAAADRVGEVFGLVLAVSGAVMVVFGALDGLWFVVLGLFLRTAARAERGADHTGTSEITAAEVMTPDPVCAPGWYTLDAFLDWTGEHGVRGAYPVTDFSGRPAGVIVLADLVRAVDAGTVGRVLDVTRPLGRVAVLAPDDPAVRLLTEPGARRLMAGGAPALVIRDGALVGTVDPAALAAALQLAALRRRLTGLNERPKAAPGSR
ncbi:site-2 protease family protein [Actinocrinis puniceicyclus]|uniref:Zinc metalloprotease n=1 Tax=Actinocrinis puniceicyclus TaxID=977794 RepID=A0A8J7WQT9_9ACTN|nr:site-2 protease family protein [Actinocrinis puniceicyclus]MBS2966931.1 site-2 protease family protein [Actinocrinis puniceicyclus]